MDFRFNSCGFWLLLQMIFTITSVIYAKDCRTCKPGYYVSRRCTEYHDTVCKPCSKGTFSSVHNVFRNCAPCSKCDLGEFVLKPCSKHKDTICESCSAVTDLKDVTEKFLKDCLQYQSDQPARSLEVPDSNGVKLHNSEESVTEKVNVIYEGSGETIVEVVNSDKNATDEEEGSGALPVIDESDKNVTSVILPDETDVKEIDVSPVTEKTTTQKVGIIVTGGGIKLENDTRTQKTNNLFASALPSTEKTITNENGGGSVIIAPIENVDVYIEDIQEDATAEYEYDHHLPQSGASKRQEDESGGTSIGVVVTVGLVAALVFFILGFLASKFWNGRRERTFNVEEAERLNGKPPVECSGMEYKDSEGRPRNKAGIYDEIPANAKVNGSAADPEKGSDPVYSKPVKRETAQTTAAVPPTGENVKPEPPPERPVSEIKYMDETEDSETDRLLQPTGSGSATGNATGSGSDVSNTSSKSEKSEPKTDGDNEKTPMLSKGHGSEKS
ncbi:uncharacterized protein LOC123537452 isoform X2 [Mercenaria mercenaria]|uniref:uncharacterized protein LOC123537452 isoform X2 n=1 Tax=Mercenaria mercenaria TaxID=6596 RepID=UPI00234E54AC|nr:uncharacterized protein LOC123537452 isoform X2 [Mercenaria mercenaria]